MAEADFTFPAALEDASLLWMQLQAGGILVPWSPPAIGQTLDLPAVVPRPVS